MINKVTLVGLHPQMWIIVGEFHKNIYDNCFLDKIQKYQTCEIFFSGRVVPVCIQSLKSVRLQQVLHLKLKYKIKCIISNLLAHRKSYHMEQIGLGK